MGKSSTFTKTDRNAKPGLFETEAAGLEWLAEANGARIAKVFGAGPNHIDLERIEESGATPEAALEFGRLLAKTHKAGAPGFGAAPPKAPNQEEGFFGPTDSPLPMKYGNSKTWGSFFADHRIRSYARMAVENGGLSQKQGSVIEELAKKVAAGEFDDDVPPARVHGDLWSGNLLWTKEGCVLIDPAAQGGHPVDDLAMLALFHAPYQEKIFQGYNEENPLPANWRQRIPLHQMFPLLMHAVVFGGGYGSQAFRIASSLL